MAGEGQEKVRRRVAFCPTCGNTAPQRILLTHTYVSTWYREDGSSHRDGPDLIAHFCVCETCSAPLLYDGIDPDEVGGDWPQLRYPEPAELDNDVPLSIHKIYAQAAKCKPGAPLAFAILIRKALEAICDDRGVEKPNRKEGDLFHRLQKLQARGDIPPTLAKMSDVLRTIGNTAAHEAPDGITVPMTWAIDEFFRAIVEYVYVAPAKIAKFESRLKRAKDGRERGA
jgi:hypothetical protein